MSGLLRNNLRIPTDERMFSQSEFPTVIASNTILLIRLEDLEKWGYCLSVP